MEQATGAASMTTPTPEQIAAWAHEAGTDTGHYFNVDAAWLARFAALVAAHERARSGKLLAEVDGYLRCVQDKSMSRNNAESLAGELQDEIRKHLTHNAAGWQQNGRRP